MLDMKSRRGLICIKQEWRKMGQVYIRYVT